MNAVQRSDQRRGAKSESPDEGLVEIAEHADEASKLMRALASPARLRILCALSQGELSVGALNRSVALSQSALSQHLAVLREEALVSTRREAQTIYYSVPDGPALQVIRVLHAAYCGHQDGRRANPRRK